MPGSRTPVYAPVGTLTPLPCSLLHNGYCHHVLRSRIHRLLKPCRDTCGFDLAAPYLAGLPTQPLLSPTEGRSPCWHSLCTARQPFGALLPPTRGLWAATTLAGSAARGHVCGHHEAANPWPQNLCWSIPLPCARLLGKAPLSGPVQRTALLISGTTPEEGSFNPRPQQDHYSHSTLPRMYAYTMLLQPYHQAGHLP